MRKTLDQATTTGAVRREEDTHSSESISVNPFQILSLLLGHRRFILTGTSAVALIAITYLLLQPNRYQSTATILPSGQNESVSTLKDLVGLGGLSTNDENSSALYPLILKSALVKDGLLAKSYSFESNEGTKSLSISEYLEETDRDRLYQGIDAITSINAGRRTGELVVGVETIYPAFSQAILQEYLSLLEDYNLNKRRSTARNNQVYLSKQLDQTKGELRTAELALQEFRQSNRDWAGSSDPEILTALTELQRDVEIKSTALVYLQQQYEIAKFNAQKDVPIVRILDTPSLPTQKSGPFRAKLVVIATLLGFLVSILAVFAREFISRISNGEFPASSRQLSKELRNNFPRTEKVVNRLVIRKGGETVEETVSEQV